MIIRAILPDWAADENPWMSKVEEGEFDTKKIKELNAAGYNIYYLPNTATLYTPGVTVKGSNIDKFQWVFVDMDLKDGVHQSKEEFIDKIYTFEIPVTRLVDSGNGIHAYWNILDLDAMGFMRLQRRMARYFNTDLAVCTIFQLMRLPGTINTKVKDDFKECVLLDDSPDAYSSEQLDAALPILSRDDEEYCVNHFNKTYALESAVKIDEKLPVKFGQLLRENEEVHDLWRATWDGSTDDRSKADFRIGHIMFASGFTKDEALSVLVNSSKAQARAPQHRVNYAMGIVEQIWTFEISHDMSALSKSVKDILARKDTTKGKRFACSRLIDDTDKGFRLGQVVGLVAGSGVGKTTVALNMFKWFTEYNPEYDHFFVSLEQPDHEIAERWSLVCQGDDHLNDKVHILSNYAEDGTFRHLSLDDIKAYLLKFKKDTGRQIGTCVIDHIGALKKQSKNGESQGLMDICHQMKGFAVETNTMVIMQSQSPREKASIGDVELNKDAAYGTVFFESYVDYLITLWQPLKRLYHKGAPTILSFKFCKIRHKKQDKDNIKEDVRYQLYYDTDKEVLRELTQVEEQSARHFNGLAAAERQKDRNDIVEYVSRRLDQPKEGNTDESI